MDRYFPLGHGQADTLLRAAPGTGPAALTAALQRVMVRYPEVTVTDPAAYQQQRASDLGGLGGVLGLLTALVLLAAAVATLGIANTLALAVTEGTPEFGLLRAVGMTARQLAAMIRWESVITAVSGALLGLTLGIGVGAAVACAVTVQQAGMATITLPASQLLRPGARWHGRAACRRRPRPPRRPARRAHRHQHRRLARTSRTHTRPPQLRLP